MPLRTPVLLLIPLIALSACRKESQVDRATREGILIAGNSNEPKSLDSQVASGVLESNLMRALFEGLVSFHPSDDAAYRLTGAVALEPDDTATVWTVRLRRDAVWNDGTPITSRDYVFTYNRILNPEFGGKYAEMLYFLNNARTYNLDRRGEILFRISPPPDLAWEAVEDVSFRGDQTLDAQAIADIDWADLDADQRLLSVRAQGLDRLGAEALGWIAEDPENRFQWPQGFRHAAAVIARLREHAGTDLFELAEVGIREIDDFTFELTLRGPTPYLPQIAKHYTWNPVPRHVVLRHGEMTDPSNPWSKKENLVSNGPFRLKSWRLNDHLEVERDPGYWNAENVSLNGIRFLPISNAYTEARMFRAGQLHITYSAPTEVVDLMKRENPDVLRQEPYVGTFFYRFNVNREPFDDPRVREALSLAIDREALTRRILYGFEPAWGITPPMGDYSIEKRETFNPERARQLLAAAGYPEGEGFPKRLKVLMTSRETNVTLGQAIQAMWRETLNIEVEIENKEWTAYLASMQDIDYDIASAGWIGDYLDPLTFLEMWTEGNGNNRTGWSNEKYEEFLERSNREADPEARFDLLRKAENILVDEQPIAIIAWYATNYLIHPAVEGWHSLLLNNHPYDTLRLEPPAN